jgi:hypothetical protein
MNQEKVIIIAINSCNSLNTLAAYLYLKYILVIDYCSKRVKQINFDPRNNKIPQRLRSMWDIFIKLKPSKFSMNTITHLDTTYLERCIATLEKAYFLLQKTKQEEIDYDLYRSACVKEYEIIIEQCGKLLRKALKPYLHSSQAVDKLYFKDIFRQCVLKSIIPLELCEHFLEYRDNRNNTAHDYGVNFAMETLILLPRFIEDSKSLVECLKRLPNDT